MSAQAHRLGQRQGGGGGAPAQAPEGLRMVPSFNKGRIALNSHQGRLGRWNRGHWAGNALSTYPGRQGLLSQDSGGWWPF